jgi:hypothetical protein
MSQVRPIGSSPIGRVYIPSSPPPQAAEEGILPFSSSLDVEFRLMLENTRNRGVFDQAKKATYRRWLENPDGLVEGDTIDQQNRDRNSRHAALTWFQLDQGCIYRKAEQRGDTLIRPRYVALNSNALEIIQKEHRALKHYGMFILCSILYIILLINIGVEKTYERISENYYGITKANVAWVIKRCNVCSLNAAAKSKAPVTPILSGRCLDRIQFDLMDFRATPDHEFNWILQIKDTFSRYIWLIPLVDKSAETVAKAFDVWIGQNGRARRL